MDDDNFSSIDKLREDWKQSQQLKLEMRSNPGLLHEIAREGWKIINNQGRWRWEDIEGVVLEWFPNGWLMIYRGVEFNSEYRIDPLNPLITKDWRDKRIIKQATHGRLGKAHVGTSRNAWWSIERYYKKVKSVGYHEVFPMDCWIWGMEINRNGEILSYKGKAGSFEYEEQVKRNRKVWRQF